MARKTVKTSKELEAPLFERAQERESISCAKRSEKQKANDVLFDALAAIFFPSGVGRDDAKRIGKAVRNLKDKNATPEDIHRRAKQWPRVYPECVMTIEALNKLWDTLGGQPKSAKLGQWALDEARRQRGA